MKDFLITSIEMNDLIKNKCFLIQHILILIFFPFWGQSFVSFVVCVCVCVCVCLIWSVEEQILEDYKFDLVFSHFPEMKWCKINSI